MFCSRHTTDGQFYSSHTAVTCTLQADDIGRVERRARVPDGATAGLRARGTGTSERQLRTSHSRDHVLHQFHHNQLHDCHQHVHRHYTGELQPGPSGRRDRHCRRRPGNVLHPMVKVSIQIGATAGRHGFVGLVHRYPIRRHSVRGRKIGF